MEELIEKLSSSLEIDELTAEQVIGIFLEAIKSEGPDQGVEKLLKAMPGADDLISKAAPDVRDASGMNGILSHALAPLVGGETLVEVFAKLESAGLDMDKATMAGYEILNFARQKVGPDVFDEIVDEIPGLKRLM